MHGIGHVVFVAGAVRTPVRHHSPPPLRAPGGLRIRLLDEAEIDVEFRRRLRKRPHHHRADLRRLGVLDRRDEASASAVLGVGFVSATSFAGTGKSSKEAPDSAAPAAPASVIGSLGIVKGSSFTPSARSSSRVRWSLAAHSAERPSSAPGRLQEPDPQGPYVQPASQLNGRSITVRSYSSGFATH